MALEKIFVQFTDGFGGTLHDGDPVTIGYTCVGVGNNNKIVFYGSTSDGPQLMWSDTALTIRMKVEQDIRDNFAPTGVIVWINGSL